MHIAGHDLALSSSRNANMGVRVVVLNEGKQLEALVVQWKALAENALEPNVFLEPYQLLPALRAFGGERERIFLCVFDIGSTQSDRERLIGFLALEKRKDFRGLPARILRTWSHPYHCLSTPLIHKRFAREVWCAILDWARSSAQRSPLLEFPTLLAEGPSYEALIDVLIGERAQTYSVDRYTRAMLIAHGEASTHPQIDSLSASQRSQLRRKMKHLRGQGHVEFKVLQADDDAESWVNDFLELEGNGWKGREGTAMLCQNAHADYFRIICREAFAAGRLHMPVLLLDGHPIAMKCNFFSSNGAFWLKVAYDEKFKKFSPGVLLEVENVEDIKRTPGIDWMDSCTTPVSYCDDLWGKRRSIEHLLIAPGGHLGSLQLGVISLIRSLKKNLSYH